MIFITCTIWLTYISSGNNTLRWLHNNITWPFCMATEVLLAVIFLFLFFAQCVMKITLKNFDNTFQVKNFFFLNQTLIVPHSKKKIIIIKIIHVWYLSLFQAEDLHKELVSTRKNLEYRFKAFTGELSTGNIHRRNRVPKI